MKSEGGNADPAGAGQPPAAVSPAAAVVQKEHEEHKPAQGANGAAPGKEDGVWVQVH
jgi:hypothetical protein